MIPVDVVDVHFRWAVAREVFLRFTKLDMSSHIYVRKEAP